MRACLTIDGGLRLTDGTVALRRRHPHAPGAAKLPPDLDQLLTSLIRKALAKIPS
jgi:hypothetical protein